MISNALCVWRINATAFFLLIFIMCNAGDSLAKPPVLVEFFTSEYCDDSPPSDDIAKSLNSIDDVIVLGCHLKSFDISNNIENGLGLDFCDKRGGLYTAKLDLFGGDVPFMVINGRYISSALRDDIARAALPLAQSDNIATIDLRFNSDKTAVNATLPRLKETGPYDMIILGFSPQMKNGRYINVITTARTIDNFIARGATMPFDIAGENQGAIIIQRPRSGPIVALGFWNKDSVE